MFALSSEAVKLLASGFKGGPKLKLLIASDGFMSGYMAEHLLACKWCMGINWLSGNGGLRSDSSSVAPPGYSVFWRTVANTRCYVLDQSGNIAPVGATGVLAIAGAAVSLGYLNRPDVERAHFVSEPGRTTADCRMFRTECSRGYAKTASWNCWGGWIGTFGVTICASIQRDRSSFAAPDNVVDAAVICVPAGPKHELTVAGFVVTKVSSEQRPAGALIQSLQIGLAAVLPAHMCPDFVAVQDSIPRLNDGRVDYKALQILASAAAPATYQSIEHSDTERRLERIWAAMLEVDRVVPTANFFEIGGHSLLAARMLTKVHKEFGRRITIAALFRAPTYGNWPRFWMNRRHGNSIFDRL